jgi:heptosyltransferase III
MPINPAYKKSGAVLYIRVNSFDEVAATSRQVDSLHKIFEGRKIFTLVAPFQEEYENIVTDKRFDRILVYPAESSSPSERSLRGLGKYLGNRGITTTVVSIRTREKTDYSRTMVASLFCPGERLFIEPDGKLTPVATLFGLSQFFGAACGVTAIMYKSIVEATTLRTQKKLLASIKYRRLNEQQLNSIRSILWVRLDHIGDVIMSLPALLALRNRYPEARIDVLTQSTNRAILQNVVGLNKIIEYNAPAHQKNGDKPSSFRTVLTMLGHLLVTRYDMIVDTRGDDNARALALLNGAPIRIGMYPGMYVRNELSLWGLAITHSGQMPVLGHCSDNAANLLREVGIEIEPVIKTLTIPEVMESEGDAWLDKHGVVAPFAIVHMNSREVHKNWLPERMAKVVHHLVKSHGLMVVLTGGPKDYEANELVRTQSECHGGVINSAGILPLNTLPAVLERARIMVTVDTGPMHIAAAQAVPIVALFHKRTVKMHYPYGQKDHVIVASEPEIEELIFDQAIFAENEESASVQPLIYIDVLEVTEMIDKVIGCPILGPAQ